MDPLWLTCSASTLRQPMSLSLANGTSWLMPTTSLRLSPCHPQNRSKVSLGAQPPKPDPADHSRRGLQVVNRGAGHGGAWRHRDTELKHGAYPELIGYRIWRRRQGRGKVQDDVPAGLGSHVGVGGPVGEGGSRQVDHGRDLICLGHVFSHTMRRLHARTRVKKLSD